MPFSLVVAGCALHSANAVAASAGNWSDFQRLVANSQKAMMANPTAALSDARSAAEIAQTQPTSPRSRYAFATGLWLEAEALIRINQISQAKSALSKASQIAAADGKTTSLDGNLALSRARLADSDGDVALELRNYQEAHAFFVRLGDLRKQSIALMGIGSVYDEAHDYDREIRYYRQAAQVYPADPALQLSAANNVGFALQESGRYEDALKDFRRALAVAVTLKSPMLEARILTNIAMTYARQHKLAKAEMASNRALRLLGKHDSSGWKPFVWGVKAQIEFERGDIRTSLTDLDKTFGGMNLSTTIAPFRDAHQIAYKVYRAAGNYPLALVHHEAFKRLDDEGRSLAASANTALMSAQFDFANQKLEIERLKSAQLQRDISLKESRAETQRVIFRGILLVGLIVIGWIGWRHTLLKRHRNVIAFKNVELTKTLSERNLEIERRKDVESQLRLAMETAQQANRAKSHFMANMSHELRTPLNAIIGFAQILSGGKVKRETAQEYGSIIALSGTHLLSILTDILDMARLEAGRVILDETTVRLGDIVHQAIAAMDPNATSGRKVIEFSGANAEILLRADEGRLLQILNHLLMNAVKFGRQDGTAKIEIERHGRGIDIVVQDDGAGISPEHLAAVMEPFGQAESAYARSHGGPGLGLPIVKSLVELHGGRLTLSSDIGDGTTARVHLPEERVVDSESAAPWLRPIKQGREPLEATQI